MKRIVVLTSMAALLLVTPGTRAAIAEGDAAIDSDIHALLDVTGSFALAEQTMRGVLAPLAQAHPQIPESFWTEMMRRVKKDDFYALLTPVYRRNLSPADIKAMLAFYKTPAGQHVIKALPLITQESLQLGQAWGRKIVGDIMGEAKTRGYKI